MQTNWKYTELPAEFKIEVPDSPICIFCKVSLAHEKVAIAGHYIILSTCKKCGWWKAKNVVSSEPSYHAGRFLKTTTGYGILKNLSLEDISAPTQVVVDYLIKNYSNINLLHPRKMEEVVASVFKDLHYDVVVTNYSGDKGIDAILTKDNQQIGLQVKRYKGKIAPAQIRELTGSLLLGKYNRGIFVTTSTFTKGAKEAAAESAAVGIPIELMDQKRFYDALQISQLDKNLTAVSYITESMINRFMDWDHGEGDLGDDGMFMNYAH